MRKLRVTVSILLLLAMTLSLCGCFKSESPDKTAGTDQPPSTDEPETLIHGIETVSYPNITAVSQYDELSEDQKAAYDAIGGALADIIKNQPEESRSYPIKKRVSMDDCLSVCELLLANFAAAEDILTALTYTDSESSDDHADTVVLPAPDNRFTESYKNCIGAIKLAANVLKDIDNDGTEYGKALAIAQWMREKVRMTDFDDKESTTYLENKPNTVYGALSYKEADVDGVAKLYDFLCKRAGLETIYVKSITDDGEVSGAWNMIRINEKWYHINVRRMDRSDDCIKYFMMPDRVCKYLSYGSSNGVVQYYFDRTADKSVAPVADTYDLYEYAYTDIDDMINYFESSDKLSANMSYFVVLPNGEDNKIFRYTGEIKSKLDDTVYYMNVKVTEDDTDIYRIYFVEKEYVPTESGKRTIEYDPKNFTGEFVDGLTTPDPDANWIMTMDIPDYLVTESLTTYHKYDYDMGTYKTVLTFSNCLKVECDYVMDETVIDLLEGYDTGLNDMGYIQQGKTSQGYDYVLYGPVNEYYPYLECDAFIRVTDKYIVHFNYSDSVYFYYSESPIVDVNEALDSVKVNTTEE